jgi:peptidoglycan/LPS O-acetylase OafA/YrhL
MSLKRGVWRAIRSLLAMASAFAVAVLVNWGGGELADATAFPSGNESRLGWDLTWVFIAGALAAWTVVKLAPHAPRAHAWVLFALALTIHVAAVMQLGGDWPRWFSAGLLLTLPLQIWVGAWWALRPSIIPINWISKRSN